MRGKRPSKAEYAKFPKLDVMFDIQPSTGNASYYSLENSSGGEFKFTKDRPLELSMIDEVFYLKNMEFKSGVYSSADEEIALFSDSGFVDKGTPEELRKRHEGLSTHCLLVCVNGAGKKCGVRLTATQRSEWMDWKRDVVKERDELEFFEQAPDFKIDGVKAVQYETKVGNTDKKVKKTAYVPTMIYTGKPVPHEEVINELLVIWSTYRGEDLENAEADAAPTPAEETTSENSEGGGGSSGDSPADDLPF